MSKTVDESTPPLADDVIILPDPGPGGQKTPKEQTVELQYRKRRWADLSRRLEDEDCAFEGDLTARGLDPLLSQYEAVKVLLNRKLVADGEKEIGQDSTRVRCGFLTCLSRGVSLLYIFFSLLVLFAWRPILEMTYKFLDVRLKYYFGDGLRMRHSLRFRWVPLGPLVAPISPGTLLHCGRVSCSFVYGQSTGRLESARPAGTPSSS